MHIWEEGFVVSARETELAKNLATVVRARRHELGLTQTDLADLAEVSTRSIHELERGKATLRLNVLLAACDALGLELRPTLRQLRATNERGEAVA